MINSLTKEQKSKFGEYIKRWTDIGLSTEPANRKLAEEGINNAYKIAGKSIPSKIVWCGSPMSQGLTKAIVFGLKDSDIKVGKNIKASVGASVRASVRASVQASVGASVWDSVQASVQASVGASVWDSVGASVWASVQASVGASVRASVGDSGYGQHDADWLGFYEYFKEVCDLESETQKLFGIWQISKNAGWWLPYENICWISERHNVLKQNSEGRLHCDGGFALQYPDGWGIYALNGTRVPEYLAVTPEGELSLDFFKKEKNADVKAEFIRKYGVSRMKNLGKVVDSWKKYDDEWFAKSEYILLDMASIFEGISYAPFLMMKNATTGTIHLEGVSPECKTIPDAIKFRCNGKNFEIAEIR